MVVVLFFLVILISVLTFIVDIVGGYWLGFDIFYKWTYKFCFQISKFWLLSLYMNQENHGQYAIETHVF